jgi:hypothetical protein
MDDSSRRLAAAYPDIVSVSETGKTQLGRPLLCLKIGEYRTDSDGKPMNALFLGLPHPNEPIGAMMLEYFTWELAKNPALREAFGYTVYVVKAWDADGAQKNEGWFKGPFTVTNYMRHFYRPAGHQQVDWTFPVDYKLLHFHDSIPETKAAMALIDRVKPRFIYNLHNAGFGGAYWYMSAPTPGIFDDLHAVPGKYNVPMHKGEPESQAADVYSDAIYACLGVTSSYDYVEKYSTPERMQKWVEGMNSGDCSAAYARERWNTFTLLTELPYFYDPRIDDTTPSDMTRKQTILQSHREGVQANARIHAILDPIDGHLDPRNPYIMAVKAFTSYERDEADVVAMLDGEPKFSELATVAQKFDSLLGSSKFYKTLSFALLRGGIDYELRQPGLSDDQRAALEAGFKAADAAFEVEVGVLESQLNYSAVPIRSLIGVQLESGLRVAEYLKEHPELC